MFNIILILTIISSIIMSLFYSFKYYSENTQLGFVRKSIMSVVICIVLFGILYLFYSNLEKEKISSEFTRYGIQPNSVENIYGVTNIPLDSKSSDLYTTYKIVNKTYTFKGVYVIYSDVENKTKVFFIPRNLEDTLGLQPKRFKLKKTRVTVDIFSETKYIDVVKIKDKLFINNNFKLSYFSHSTINNILYPIYSESKYNEEVIEDMLPYKENIKQIDDLINYLKKTETLDESKIENIIK